MLMGRHVSMGYMMVERSSVRLVRLAFITVTVVAGGFAWYSANDVLRSLVASVFYHFVPLWSSM